MIDELGDKEKTSHQYQNRRGIKRKGGYVSDVDKVLAFMQH